MSCELENGGPFWCLHNRKSLLNQEGDSLAALEKRK